MRKTELFRKRQRRQRRVIRVRKKIWGSPERPRMCVSRSLRNIRVQLIDDTQGKTLVDTSTLSPEIRDIVKGKKKTEQASLVGDFFAKKVLEKGINTVVFDRHGYKYHGRVKALAESARKAGLKF